MVKLKDYIKDKGIGFYFTIAIALLSLITAIVYVSCYVGTREMSWWVFAFALIGCLGAIALVVFKQFNWAPVSLAVFNGLSFMFFVHAMSFYVSVVFVGIDAHAFNAPFIVCAILLAILFVTSIANIFLKQIKSDNVVASSNGSLVKAKAVK